MAILKAFAANYLEKSGNKGFATEILTFSPRLLACVCSGHRSQDGLLSAFNAKISPLVLNNKKASPWFSR